MHLNRTTVLEPQQGSLDPFLSIKVCQDFLSTWMRRFLTVDTNGLFSSSNRNVTIMSFVPQKTQYWALIHIISMLWSPETMSKKYPTLPLDNETSRRLVMIVFFVSPCIY